jgi:hypothetical protein
MGEIESGGSLARLRAGKGAHCRSPFDFAQGRLSALLMNKK